MTLEGRGGVREKEEAGPLGPAKARQGNKPGLQRMGEGGRKSMTDREGCGGRLDGLCVATGRGERAAAGGDQAVVEGGRGSFSMMRRVLAS